MKIILLRPKKGGQQSAIIARQFGFDPIIAPASEIRPIAWDRPPPSDFDSIMITSANALRVNHQQITAYAHLPLYAVGKATAKLALEMGFTIAGQGKGGAAALWPLLQKDNRRRILRIVGMDYIPIDSDSITTIITYEAAILPMHDDLRDLLQNPNAPHIFAFHSVRAVQIFNNYISDLPANMAFDTSRHIAISLAPTITQALGSNWQKIITSPSADDNAMMKSLSEILGA